ncbi:hypothetical protein HELRODRAFT_170903 [Helobdella robusta]|uniref:Uncharacterized protein n=1 Tax=Helobdella robusta TaxID=6412 RepID=T1F3K8_HELRO|nr:hypothetical protein HELRODRAFT_170903 [Helobdella robusta]ESO06873.1 hypothetical protein HELRODRAFT_170903 [Helobdella robusta]
MAKLSLMFIVSWALYTVQTYNSWAENYNGQGARKTSIDGYLNYMDKHEHYGAQQREHPYSEPLGTLPDNKYKEFNHDEVRMPVRYFHHFGIRKVPGEYTDYDDNDDTEDGEEITAEKRSKVRPIVIPLVYSNSKRGPGNCINNCLKRLMTFSRCRSLCI